MSDPIYVEQGKLVVDTSFIPYIRRQDVVFESENLRPRKVARLYIDDVVVNQFSQKANEVVLNSEKILSITPNTSATISADYYVYQGSSDTEPSFSGIVKSYNSGTLVIKSMSGNFDDSASLNFEETVGNQLKATADIKSFTNANTADVFYKNEPVICTNTKTYMEVIGNSGENILYLNQNFATINAANIGSNSLNSMVGHYNYGDIVYQTVHGEKDTVETEKTFIGKVEYYDNNEPAVISLTTIKGKINTSPTNSATARLYNASNSSSAVLLLTGYNQANIEENHIIRSLIDLTKEVPVVSYNHSSGLFANTTVIGSNVFINSSNTSTAVGNVFYITSGTGIGQFRKIVDIDGNRVELDSALYVSPTSSSKYSIGNHIVDKNGNLTGIINIPEEPGFKFRTGERIFTITDTNTVSNPDFTMKASAKFIASGLLNKTQRIVTTPIGQPLPEYEPDNPIAPVNPSERTFASVPNQSPVTGSALSSIPKVPLADGLSQTFFTPKSNSNKPSSGIFVTSVDLFFSNKPSVANGSLQLPITVKIAEVVNGFPTKNYVASTTVKAKDVKISTSPSASNTATLTKFTFGDPVYLAPDSEYAIVINADSPEYELYVAELGGEVLGADPPRRISEQPYSGSLFKSQNSSTWTPYQNEDLMFVINKAVFKSSGDVSLHMKNTPVFTQNVHRLLMHTDQLAFPRANIEYKVLSYYANNNAQDSGNYVKPNKIFNYGSLLDGSNKIQNNNSRKIIYGNANSIVIQAEYFSADEDISPVLNKESFSIATGEYLINNAGLSNNVISITNKGIGYINAVAGVYGSTNNTVNTAALAHRTTYHQSNVNVALYNITISGPYGSGATGFAVANTNGANTIDYAVITYPGSGYIETPTISIAAAAATTNVNAAAIISGETSRSGGNIEAKYVTRQFVLEDGFEAGDLRVFLDAIRPTGTDIQVYYKVLSVDDPDKFADKSWVRMFKKIDRYSTNQRQLIDLEYHPNLTVNKLSYTENGKLYPIGGKFKYFAIKIGLLSTDSTVIPTVNNIRILATPEG